MTAPVKSTAVATVERKAHPIVEMMTSTKALEYIAPFLPEGVDANRVAASVLLAMKLDESGLLRKCTPESIITGVAQIHQWGLELAKDVAYLLPFKDTKAGTYKAVPCADYKALAAQLVASGAVRFVDAREVRQGDRFEYEFGLDAKCVHQPFGGKDRIKRPITHAYVVFRLPFGASAFDVMTAEEIEEVRQNYSKQHKGGPLKRFYAVKTVLRRAAKLLPKDRRLSKFFATLEADTHAEIGGDPAAVALRETDEDRPQLTAGTERDERCICNADTGEVDPNCPTHGDYAGEG